jgi:ADP-heptose:LPS heptosyltransferase
MSLKSLKDSLAALTYSIVLRIVRILPATKGENTLLIIKTDEIGDYVLFHSYLKYFKKSARYKNHKIVLVGNSAWRQIYEAYDKDCVDKVIWLNKKNFKKDLLYRYRFLQQIRMLQASDVVNCIFSRSLKADDAIAWVATGDHKIAMKGDDTNRGRGGENRDSEIYSEVIDAGDISIFDAERNRNFISKILDIKNISIETKINVRPAPVPLPFKYYILFLGAGNPERKWPIDYFIETAEHIHNKSGLVPVICGGPDDTADADVFAKGYNKQVANHAGKTNLMQLVELLAGAEFLICVDTGALHIAAAVGRPVIGLYSGKFYGRFAPYPKAITEKFYPVYPDFVEELIAKKAPVLYNTFVMKNDTIKMIEPGKVMLTIAKLLGEVYNNANQ